MNIIKVVLVFLITTALIADMAIPLTTQQKENKSLIIIDAEITSITLIARDSSRGSLVESSYVAKLSNITVVKDQKKLLNFRKIASYRLYFTRIPSPYFEGEKVPEFKAGDKARIYLTEKGIKFQQREALLVVNSSNDIEIFKDDI